MNSFKLFRVAKTLVRHRARNFSTGVYLWTDMPGIGPKSQAIARISIPKGKPERVKAFDSLDIKTIRVGLRHSAAISQDGKLFMFGSGNWGVLGQGNETDVRFDKPIQVTKFEKLGLKVVDCCLGEYHTMVLTDDGNVWTWGYAGKKGFFNWMYTQEIGALGHGDKEPQFAPKKVMYFQENGIKVKSISAGLYHCNALTANGELYSWGRGLYGVLGDGTNSHALTPQMNEDIAAMAEEEGGKIVKMDSADEYSVVQLQDGSIHAWGKNDRGQLGTGAGIGIDMVECENVPTPIDVRDDQEKSKIVKNFVMGQGTMLIQDTEDNIFQTGLRINYTPKQFNFSKDLLDTKNVRLMGCGRKHYIIVTKDNNLLTWGNVFKEKVTDPSQQTEGFSFYYGDTLFDGSQISQLEVKYSIFGALVKD